MKKIYMTPITQSVKVKIEHVLAADSMNNFGNGDEPDNEVKDVNDVLGKRGYSIWDDEEE